MKPSQMSWWFSAAGRFWNPLIQALAEDLQDAMLGHSFTAPFEWIVVTRDTGGADFREYVLQAGIRFRPVVHRELENTHTDSLGDRARRRGRTLP